MRDLPEVPPDPRVTEHFEGDNIDDEDWSDVARLWHWLHARRGALCVGPQFEQTWQVSTTTPTSTDADGEDLFHHPVTLRMRRPEADHDDWIGADQRAVIVRVLGNDYLGVEVDFIGFLSTRTRQNGAVSTTETFTLEDGDVTGATRWGQRSWIVDAQHELLSLAFRGFSTTSDQTAEWEETIIYEVPLVNQSTFLNDLLIFGSAWVGTYGTGDGVETWDADGATLSLDGNINDLPTMDRQAVNTGTDSAPVHACTIDSDFSHFVTEAQDWEAGGFVWACTLRRDDTTNPDIWESAGDNAVVFEVYEDGSGNLVATIRTSGGTFTVFASHDGTGTWEDWLVHWDGNRLVLYKNGIRQDQVAATGTLSDTSVNHYLGVDAATNGGWQGDVALPVLFDADLSEYAVERILAWRRSYTGLGASLSVP